MDLVECLMECHKEGMMEGDGDEGAVDLPEVLVADGAVTSATTRLTHLPTTLLPLLLLHLKLRQSRHQPLWPLRRPQLRRPRLSQRLHRQVPHDPGSYLQNDLSRPRCASSV